MLGLADRERTIDLFGAVMRGDVAAALTELREQYDTGADPVVVLADLAEFTHFVTRVKIVPAVADDVALAEVERTRGRAFAEKLSMRVLARAWQMLLKGAAEVEEASRPLAAAEMVLVRMAYAADLPTPDEVIRALDGNAAPARAERNGGAAALPGTTGAQAPRVEMPRETPSFERSRDTSRVEPPRGAPRAALAPAGQPAGWGRRCWRASLAPRSWTCARARRRRRHQAMPIAMTRRRNRRRPMTVWPMGPTGAGTFRTTISSRPVGRPCKDQQWRIFWA